MTDRPDTFKPRTIAAQALGAIEPETKGVALPIHVSTTFIRDPDNQYRTGYIYGLAEWTERKDAPRNAWTTEMEIDKFRLDTERATFDHLVGELENTWMKVVREYASPAAAGAVQ